MTIQRYLRRVVVIVVVAVLVTVVNAAFADATPPAADGKVPEVVQ